MIMMRRWRDEEEMQDRLVAEGGLIVKFPLVPLATCLPPLHYGVV